MTTKIPVARQVKDLLQSSFKKALPDGRQIGVEDEFAVVDQTGQMADITSIFPILAANGWKEKLDPITTKLIGVSRDDLEIGMDVGLGTLEVAFAPVRNLYNHLDVRRRTLAMIDSLLATRGMKRLADYACQPLTLPDVRCWAPKGRADVFRRIFPAEVHAQTISAAGQVHIEATRDEALSLLSLYLSIAPILIALNANSPVWNGQLDPDGMLAARQNFWYRFTGWRYWNNVYCGTTQFCPPLRPTEKLPESWSELAYFMAKTQFIVRVDNGRTFPTETTFQKWVENTEDLSAKTFADAYEDHEGTVWWDARLRVPYGTVEVRPMCQNKDIVATHALLLGLAENLNASLEFVRDFGHYRDWRQLQFDTLRNGLSGYGLSGYGRIHSASKQLLVLAEEGLQRRGLREEVLLEPLKQRLIARRSPGHDKKDAFQKGGVPALLELLFT